MNIVEEKINDEIWNSREDHYKEMIKEVLVYRELYFYIDGVGDLADLCMRIAFYMRLPDVGYDQYMKLKTKFDETIDKIEELTNGYIYEWEES